MRSVSFEVPGDIHRRQMRVAGADRSMTGDNELIELRHEIERLRWRHRASVLKWFLIIVGIVLTFALSACATDPITDLQRQAWAEPWELCPGDWEPKFECDCKNRALAIKQRALAQGREVAILVGYRDRWPGVLHMVAVVDGVVLDQDRAWPIEQYLTMWEPGPDWYDWRVTQDAWKERQG